MTKRTIAAMFQEVAAAGGDRPALMYKSGGTYIPVTWRQYRQQVAQLANWLMASGLQAGDRVALLCETRYEWVIADMAMHASGLINVPIYPTLTASQAAYILQDSGARAAIVSGPKQADKVLGVLNDCPELREILYIGDEAQIPEGRTLHTWAAALAKGAESEAHWAAERASRQAAIDPHSLCSIIYTSGTTGNPKGVMLSHHNFLSNAGAVVPLAGIGPEDTAISFLPLSHVLERVMYYGVTLAGATIAYAESIDAVAANLGEIRPTIMATVPRLLEKVYARIHESVDKSPALKQKLFAWALEVGRRHRLEQKPDPIAFALADRLVFRAIRQRFGGRLRLLVCGGAPMVKEIGEFFAIAGLNVCEGYGLTETSPVISVNYPGHIRIGTVGPILPEVSVRIADDGEICAKGPNVMLGYYNLPDATRDAFDADGWFHTGDIGEIDADGFLRITDRKKELLVLSNGKNVAPQPIENQLKTSVYIEQAMVIGDNRKYCSALIVPDFAKLQAFAQSQGLPTGKSELIHHPRVLDLLRAEIDRTTQTFAQFERIKRFHLLPDEWTVESGELTPTLKCKRKIILKNNAAIVAELFAEAGVARG